MPILHIGFVASNEPEKKKIKEVFDDAHSWLRYAPNCWLLWTDLSADEWTVRLEKVIEKEKRHFFICQLNLETTRAGSKVRPGVGLASIRSDGLRGHFSI